MKIIKYIIITIVCMLALFACVSLVAYFNKENLDTAGQKLSVQINNAKDIRNVSFIKLVSLSIMQFENERGNLPVTLNELSDYASLSQAIADTGIAYNILDIKSSHYILCAPYTAPTTDSLSDEYSTWFIQNGSICLSRK